MSVLSPLTSRGYFIEFLLSNINLTSLSTISLIPKRWFIKLFMNLWFYLYIGITLSDYNIAQG